MALGVLIWVFVFFLVGAMKNSSVWLGGNLSLQFVRGRRSGW